MYVTRKRDSHEKLAVRFSGGGGEKKKTKRFGNGYTKIDGVDDCVHLLSIWGTIFPDSAWQKHRSGRRRRGRYLWIFVHQRFFYFSMLVMVWVPKRGLHSRTEGYQVCDKEKAHEITQVSDNSGSIRKSGAVILSSCTKTPPFFHPNAEIRARLC